MDRLRELEILVAVADAGGLARAGRRLGLSPPTVTRAIAGLERRLGIKLFNRTTRSLVPTETGLRFVERARRLVAESEALEREAAGEASEPHGHLTVTASATFGRVALAPVLGAFADAYPKITVTAVLLDRVANLIDEGIDVAIRIAELPDSSLAQRRIGAIRRVLVASPDYLARRGTPRRPQDLEHHDVIAFSGLGLVGEWRYRDEGRARQVALRPRLEINDAAACIGLALEGRGITFALSYMVGAEIARGELVEVLSDVAPPPVPVNLVHAEGRLASPKLRAFMDFAAPRLQAALAGLQAS